MKRVLASLVLVFVLLCAAAIAHLSSPPPACTGAPGEGTCANAGCHDSYPVNSGQGYVLIDWCYLGSAFFDSGSSWLPIAIRSTGAQRWGFQITALDQAGNPAGFFVPTDTFTQVIVGPNGRSYGMHTQAGSTRKDWRLSWVTPDTSVGIVTFFLSGVAANGDGLPTGDLVFTKEQRALPGAFVEWCMAAVLPGDLNYNGSVTSADLIALVNYVFKGTPFSDPCMSDADVNCSGFVTSADIIYLVAYIFKGGNAPCYGCCSFRDPC